MISGRRWGALGAGVLSCLSTHAQAAGPYAVDDAAIGNPGECQVESLTAVMMLVEIVGGPCSAPWR